jgi:hypothetical protein
MKKIKIPKSFKIEVGLWNDVSYPDGLSVATVAALNVYGTKEIPARNFFTFRREELSQRVKEIAIDIMRKSNRNLDASGDIDKIGILAATFLKQAVTDLRTPPNSAVTIARKGSSNPLIDTGLLRRSIKWKITEISYE